MESDEKIPSVAENPSVGPETATRDLGVRLGRKVLSDLVLGFSALTMIGVLEALQFKSENIFLFVMETITTAALSIWLTFLLFSLIPAELYERMNRFEKLSIGQLTINALGILLWGANFYFVSRFVSSTVAELGNLAVS